MADSNSIGRWTALGALAFLYSAHSWAQVAQATEPSMPLEQRFKAAQDAVAKAMAGRARQHDAEKAACNEAEAADAALQTAPSAGPALARLLQASLDAQMRCESAKADLTAANTALAGANLLMRSTAQQLVAAQTSPAPVTPATTTVALGSLFERAGKVQDQVDGVRAFAATAFNVGDSATAAGLKVDLGQASQATQDSPASLFADWTHDAQTLPGRLQSELSALQRSADRVIRLALEARRSCPGSQTAACQSDAAYQQAEASLAAFDLALTQAKTTQAALEKARYGLETLADTKDLAQWRYNPGWEQRLTREANFRRLLSTDADIKSFFADDAVGLSAAKSGTDATLRYTMNFGTGLRVNRLTLLGTVPATLATPSNPLRSTDGMVGKKVLGLAYQRTSPGFQPFKETDLIFDISTGLKVAHAPYGYLLPDSNGVYSEVKKDLVDSEASLNIAGMFYATEDPKHLLTLSYREQRIHGYKNPNDGVKVRCLDDPQRAPGKPLDCVTAGLGAPVLLPNRLLSLEWRYDFGKVALAPKITRSFTASSTAFDLPIYFIRNQDDKTSKAFTGGISLGWDSARQGLNYGLFVSTPLTFSRSKPE